MSRIMRIIDTAKAFANTNPGKVATVGLTYMATMAMCGGIAAKFFPGKATFGRAIGLGLYTVGMQTLVGTTVAAKQQERIKGLQERLSEQQQRLKKSNARLRHANKQLYKLRKEAARH